MNALKRNNVVIAGHGVRPMVFAHGFGCDQHMWRFSAFMRRWLCPCVVGSLLVRGAEVPLWCDHSLILGLTPIPDCTPSVQRAQSDTSYMRQGRFTACGQ